jgi:hypothetical protein
LEGGVCSFMNYAHNAFSLYPDKIRAHQVVVRQIQDGIGGKRARWQRKNENRTTQDRQFHPRENRRAHIE